MRKGDGFGELVLRRKNPKPEELGGYLARKRQPAPLEWKKKAPILRQLLGHSVAKTRLEATLTELFFLDKYGPAFNETGGTLIIAPGDPRPVPGADLVMLNLFSFSGMKATIQGRTGGQPGVVYVQFPVAAHVKYVLDVEVKSQQLFGFQLWEGPIFDADGGQGTDLTKFVGQGQGSALDGHVVTAFTAKHDGTAYIALYASLGSPIGVPWDFFQCEVSTTGP